MTLPRLADVRDLLDTALLILGPAAGRVEIVDGSRRVRVGRLAGLADEAALPLAPGAVAHLGPAAAVPEGVVVRAPAIGVVSFLDNRTGRPFVSPGQQMARGQTIAFISALDVTTKVIAPSDGVVEEVFVEDGDGVEYNAPLLKLFPPA